MLFRISYCFLFNCRLHWKLFSRPFALRLLCNSSKALPLCRRYRTTRCSHSLLRPTSFTHPTYHRSLWPTSVQAQMSFHFCPPLAFVSHSSRPVCLYVLSKCLFPRPDQILSRPGLVAKIKNNFPACHPISLRQDFHPRQSFFVSIQDCLTWVCFLYVGTCRRCLLRPSSPVRLCLLFACRHHHPGLHWYTPVGSSLSTRRLPPPLCRG